jgi:hypothetical protein
MISNFLRSPTSLTRRAASSVFRLRLIFASLLFLTILCAVPHSAGGANLIDVWKADDLDVLNDGDAVGSWTSANSRTLTAAVTAQPLLKKGVTPTGSSVVRFKNNWLKTYQDSPVAGLTNFSIALVFKADAPGANESSQWYGKSGIVDAEQGGVTQDWGTVIDENGHLGLGIGGPDNTVYSSSAPSLVDGKYHAAVLTWGASMQYIIIDNSYIDAVATQSQTPRNNAGFSMGSIHTGEGGSARRFSGDLVEIRFYDAYLEPSAAVQIISDLTDAHIILGRPTINSFTASTNQIYIGQPVTLAWNVTNATYLAIDPLTNVITNAIGSIDVFPRTNITYTLIATNTLGLKFSQVTVTVDQGIPTANNQTLNASANTPCAITLTGSDPQGSNLTYTVIAPPTDGILTGVPPDLSYLPNTNFVGNDQFTFKVSDGEFDSPPATVSLRVLAAPASPSAIVLSTTNISAAATSGSPIAFLRAVDINPEDTHTFLLVPGQADNAQFLIDGNQLKTSAIFSGGLGSTFSIRVRVTDSSGLALEQTFNLSVVIIPQNVVINEIHYNPPDNTIPEEFIELHNPSPDPIDVSLWQITGGVNFVIPPGNSIPGGGFLVVAKSPATIQSRYGITALGPWTGNLSSDGETITLLNANGKKFNEVSYTSEFPWPILTEGGSIALVNPSLDNNLGSSWRVELPCTPGHTNAVLSANPAPNIRQVRHTPQSPASTNQIVVTAKVTDPDGVASVQLQYQVVAPGFYLPSVLPVPVNSLIANPGLEPTPNPAFDNPTNWTTLLMVDDGSNGDVVAGDDIYTAVIPPQANRSLVRYRIVITDIPGATRRAPFEDDPSLNFACFVYDGIPAYQGVSSQTLESLPVYFVISRPQDISQCAAYDGSYQLPQFANNGLAHLSRFAFNWPGTIVYDGVVYDHIRYRLHGANGRYQPGKRNWRFALNSGHYLAAKDQNGQLFPRKWTHLTTGKGSCNRLVPTFSLNESVNYFLWNKVGVPAPGTFYFHYRVITGANEAPSQYAGDFWGLNWAQEDYDGRFLDAHKMAKGNLYKLINAPLSYDMGQDMVGQQRYQGALAVNDGSDGAAIQRGLLSAQTSDWIKAHVNCTEWYRFHAICEAVRNYDFWPDANKNAAWYFEPPYSASNDFHGRFWTLPWDTDSTWGPTWNAGQDLTYNGIFLAASHPDLTIEYQNTVREIRDLLFQPDQINPLINAFAAQIHDFVPADLMRWSNAPASGGNYVSLTSGAGFISPALSGGVNAYVQDMQDFMFKGGTHPWWIDQTTVAAGGWVTRLDGLAADATIPARPVITYVGAARFAVSGLLFQTTAFTNSQAGRTFAAMQWRVAEITPTNTPASDPAQIKMEWDPVWDSGEMTTFTNLMKIPAVSVLPNHVYRTRVRHKDNTGRWSNWSQAIEFTPSMVDLISDLQKHLVISEIMYNPPGNGTADGSDLEFLELKNTGTNTLDLSGLTFTAGITFTFTNATTLGPGQYFVLGRNIAALQAKYPGLLIKGVYTGKLDNAGETITLSHPYGDIIFSLTYGTLAPWPVTANGYGFSLVLDESNPGHYRASAQPGGSPGAVDPATTIPNVVINEILSNPIAPALQTVELWNPTSTTADIGGWFVTDDASYPWKYRIPDDTNLNAGAFLTIDESQFNAPPDLATSFRLNPLGGEVYLFSGNAAHELTGYSHGFSFPGAARGETFGRYINSVGQEHFPPQATPTLSNGGSTNSGPRVGPIVISEICYSPATGDSAFIELLNVSQKTVSLYDPAIPTNTWRMSGLGFVFPQGVSIPSGGMVLLTAGDPVTFRAARNIPTAVQIFQYTGQLQTNGESLELRAPEIPETNGVPFFSEDLVRYETTAPWPMITTGSSPQRIHPELYGNDPANWQSGSPNPGVVTPLSPAMILLGVQLDPLDKQPVLTFAAEASRFYRLQYQDQLTTNAWIAWIDLSMTPIQPTNRVISIKDTNHNTARFYRVTTQGF